MCVYECNDLVVSGAQAKTRVKLNFLDNLAKFWELQVSNLCVEHVIDAFTVKYMYLASVYCLHVHVTLVLKYLQEACTL